MILFNLHAEINILWHYSRVLFCALMKTGH